LKTVGVAAVARQRIVEVTGSDEWLAAKVPPSHINSIP